MYIPKINKDVTGITFTDELHANVGASAFQIDHDYFLGGLDLTIRTASGGGGTLLTPPPGGDYVLGSQNAELETAVNAAIGPGKTVYKTIQVTNATYQTGNLYFSGKYIADDNSYPDVEYLKRHSNKLAGSATPYTIDEADNYSLYKITTGGSLNIVNLPAAADAEDQVFKIRKEDSGVGCIRITPDGSEKVVASSGAELGYVFLFTKGDIVEIMSNGTDWFIINSFKPYFLSGWRNWSVWGNKHLGFLQIAYGTLTGSFTTGEIITLASGVTGIVIDDTTSVLTCVSATGVGNGVSAESITGNTSGATAVVSTSTKNLDTDILYNWSTNIKNIRFEFRISSDGSENNAKTLSQGTVTPGGNGIVVFQIDANTAKGQTGSNAAGTTCNDSGVANNIDTDDWYFNIRVNIL